MPSWFKKPDEKKPDDQSKSEADLLIEKLGASMDERAAFVEAHTSGGCREWRFRGLLGMGGKFRVEPWACDFYSEDRNAERDVTLAELNAALDNIK